MDVQGQTDAHQITLFQPFPTYRAPLAWSPLKQCWVRIRIFDQDPADVPGRARYPGTLGARSSGGRRSHRMGMVGRFNIYNELKLPSRKASSSSLSESWGTKIGWSSYRGPLLTDIPTKALPNTVQSINQIIHPWGDHLPTVQSSQTFRLIVPLWDCKTRTRILPP